MSGTSRSGKMAWVPGGTFRTGGDDFYPEEGPAHDVRVSGFWMDASRSRWRSTAASSRRPATGPWPSTPRTRPTTRAPRRRCWSPGVWLRPPGRPVNLRDPRNWWSWVPGAQWRHPEGPGSSTAGRERHPVTQVAWADAAAYAAWAGKDLPTEAEWERAARGGLDGATFSWGNEARPGGRVMANTWHGRFPVENLKAPR